MPPGDRRVNLSHKLAPAWVPLLAMQASAVFNENLLKQAALLWLTGASPQDDQQSLALACYAAPFLLASGLAGLLCDRISKRWVIVACRAAEWAMWMGLLLVVGVSGHLSAIVLLLALVAMATRATILIPAKYGILPEAFDRKHLTALNGAMQAVAYLSIVAGVSVAGALLLTGEQAAARVCWLGGSLALVGSVAAWLLPPVARMDTSGDWNWAQCVAPVRAARSLLRDRLLRDAMIVYATFWLMAGMFHPTANALGRVQLGLDDLRTSLLVAASAVGVAIGGALAAAWPRSTHPQRRVVIAGWGMVACQLALGLAAAALNGPYVYPACLLLIALLGVCTGLFVVPLHVVLQSRPADDQRGGVMAAQNFINWTAVLLSALLYSGVQRLLLRLQWPPSSIFLLLAAVSMAGLACLRPTDNRLLRGP